MNVPGLQCLQGVERCCHFPLASLLLPTYWARSEPDTAPWQDPPSLWPGLGARAVPLHPAQSGGECLCAVSCVTQCPTPALGYFGGDLRAELCSFHPALCPPACNVLLPVLFVGSPMPGAGGGSCGLLPPAVALLLSYVIPSRAWTELEGEGGTQLVHFHALEKRGGPLYLSSEGPESVSSSACCCWPGCWEGQTSGTAPLPLGCERCLVATRALLGQDCSLNHGLWAQSAQTCWDS